MPKSTKFNRLIVAGIAAAALTPASALAQPAIDGGLPPSQPARTASATKIASGGRRGTASTLRVVTGPLSASPQGRKHER